AVARHNRDLVLEAVEEGPRAADVVVADVRADAAELEATNAAETAGVEAVVHRSVAAGPRRLAAERQHMLAATVQSTPGAPEGGVCAGDERIGEVAKDLLVVQVEHASLGQPEVVVAAIPAEPCPDTDQRAVTAEAGDLWRRVERHILDVDPFNPRGDAGRPV